VWSQASAERVCISNSELVTGGTKNEATEH
jgi:hypothetical protein